MLLAVSSTLDPKAFSGRIASVLPLGIGVGFLFRGIVNSRKIKPAILLKGLVRI